MPLPIRAVTGSILFSISLGCLAQTEAIGPILLDAQSVVINGFGHHKTFPCNGRKLLVEGTGHVITMTGVCSKAEISGAGNKVEVAIEPTGTLIVAGTEHDVRWKSSGEPTQDLSGIDNKVTRVD